MARKQCDLFGDNSQPWTPPPARLRDGLAGVSKGNVLGRPASIKIDLAAGRVVENQKFPALWGIFEKHSNFGKTPSGNPALPLECCVAHGTNITRVKTSCQYYPDKNLSGGFTVSAPIPAGLR